MGEKKNNCKAEEKYINFSDDKINVLLLGNSGCGKSTLINAFLGREGHHATRDEGAAIHGLDPLHVQFRDGFALRHPQKD